MGLSAPSDVGGDRWVRVQSPAPRDVWRELLATDPNALFFHSPEWIDQVCAAGGYQDASRLYETRTGWASAAAASAPYPVRWAVLRTGLPAGGVGNRRSALRQAVGPRRDCRGRRRPARRPPCAADRRRTGASRSGCLGRRPSARRQGRSPPRSPAGARPGLRPDLDRALRQQGTDGGPQGGEVGRDRGARHDRRPHPGIPAPAQDVDRALGATAARAARSGPLAGAAAATRTSCLQDHGRTRLPPAFTSTWPDTRGALSPASSFYTAAEPATCSGRDGQGARQSGAGQRPAAAGGHRGRLPGRARLLRLREHGTTVELAAFKMRFGAQPVSWSDYVIERLPVTEAGQAFAPSSSGRSGSGAPPVAVPLKSPAGPQD